MTGKSWVSMAAVLGLAFPAVVHAESASVLLERGIHQEEAVGNLDAAMGIYRKIVDDARADRKFIAEAHLRLGACYLKKQQHRRAILVLEELIGSYPDQGAVVAKARAHLAAARGAMTGPELAKVVREAVTVISTCAETAPRVRGQLDGLRGLNPSATVKELVKYLTSEKATIRRSAVYILWKAELPNIDGAVDGLMKLTAHEAELTRGMAALALGGRKVARSYRALCDMALKDSSAFARRCAAYALGLMGRPEAKAVLEKVLKDKDPFVRSNAEAALTMLSGGTGLPSEEPKVVRTSPENFAADVPATCKEMSVTFDRRMMDGCWAWVRRWADKYPKTTGGAAYDGPRKTCTVPVTLEPGKVYWVGINTPPYTSFQAVDHTRARPHVLLFATKSADGKPTPIPEDLLAQAKAIIAAAAKPAPTVVSTTPTALSRDVPASLGTVTVTFDQPMEDRSWSWVKFDNRTYPKTTGDPSYDKVRRTCSLPVKLEAGKVYWVQINSERHKFFQNAADKPARPYVILFATRGRDGKPTAIPRDLLRRAEAINAATRQAAAGADRRRAEALAAEGWRLWNQRKLAEAEVKFEEAVLTAPTLADAWNGLGWAKQNQGKHENARHAFQRCLKIQPDHAGALNGMGWIAKIKGDTKAAIAYWKQAVEALPSATAALNGLTMTLVELGRHDEAIAYYEKWLAAEPGNAQAKAGLAKVRQAKAGAGRR